MSELPEGRIPYEDWAKLQKYAVVRTVQTFYHEYIVPMDELQKLNTDSEADVSWLEDAVTSCDVDEVGQKHLGEQIISAEVVSEEKALKMFDEINDYLSSWSDEQKIYFMRKTLPRKD